MTLIDGGDQAVARLVRTAAALFDRPDFGPAALIGGLAVTVRLATVYRATNDVDVVSGGDVAERTMLEYLGDRDGAGTRRSVIDGIKVDVMSTDACKLHAIGDRSAARPEKQESDAADLVRPISDLVGIPGLHRGLRRPPSTSRPSLIRGPTLVHQGLATTGETRERRRHRARRTSDDRDPGPTVQGAAGAKR